MASSAQWRRLYDELYKLYGDCTCPLKHASPFQLLVAVMLSAQCRDDRVNEVTKELFAVAPDPASMAELPVERIAEIIRTCGLYRNKSENLSACAKKLVDEFGGEVPHTMEELTTLPGIGRKSAVRMAFAVLDLPDETVEGFSEALLGAKRKIRHCAVCHNFSVDEICPICADSTRDTSLICVVEDAKAVLAFEKIRGFRGDYNVHGGVISEINCVTPDKLNIADLAARVKDGVREVIVATNPTVEGETTAMFISKLLKPLGVRVSRLAYGIPVGGDIEYADEVTLNRAIEGRQDF